MPGNSFGTILTVSTWGESHGKALGVVIDGCPPNIEISEEEIQIELDRRRPGQSKIVTPRQEKDKVEILSGVFEGKTTGTPISLAVFNHDAKSSQYNELQDKYRPSHADLTYDLKYGIRNWQGGGRASARETIGRVASGVIARKIIKDIEIIAYVSQIHGVKAEIDHSKVSLKDVEKNIVRCPDQAVAKKMQAEIEKAQKDGDTVGGVIECVIKNCPAGLGSPVFDKLEAKLAHAMLSLPATKGFEIGSGFAGTLLKGSQHNDVFVMGKNELTGKKAIRTQTNNSGGVQGGISNGEIIVFRVAFKPVATIFKEQKTVDKSGKNTSLKMTGRHDPCVLPRAVPIVEAMAALVLADEFLVQKTVR